MTAFVCEITADGLHPDPDITVTEWADRYRYLPSESSSIVGRYRSERTPYMREIMDSLSNMDPCQEVVFMKGTQLGATEAGNNWAGYVIDVAPGPMLMIMPTKELAEGHSTQKLEPTIRDTPRLADKVAEQKSRSKKNTLLTKTFPGGVLFLGGANSPAGFRSKSIRYLFVDDLDGNPENVGGEGDSIMLAKSRTDSFGSRRKIFYASTPTIKDISRIEALYLASDQRRYHVPCPFCGEMQPLEWGGPDADFGIKFLRDEAGQPVEVWYECRGCHQSIDESHKTAMMAAGNWVPTHPGRLRKGYQLSGLYSPLGMVPWLQIVQEFLEVKSYPEQLKTWVNNRLGRPFEGAGDRPDWRLLADRMEPYPQWHVPAGGLLLTAGVDVQGDRLAVVVRAWGMGEESWLVWEGELWGDTGDLGSEAWTQLDGLLNRAFDGRHMASQIASMAVDSGFHTQTVYNWCRTRTPRVIACKGSSQKAKPIIGRPTRIDVDWRGETIKGGIDLWPIGTDIGKQTLYSRFSKALPGPGMYHWPEGTREDYFRQITAERLVTKIVKGYPTQEWVKVGPRNEALDCELLSYAAAIRSGIAYLTNDFKPAQKPREKKKPKQSKVARW